MIIDAVCNMFTPEIYQSRPDWTRKFHTQKMKVAGAVLDGVSISEHVELLNKAGISKALLIAAKLGRRGLEDSWELDAATVASACVSSLGLPSLVGATLMNEPHLLGSLITYGQFG